MVLIYFLLSKSLHKSQVSACRKVYISYTTCAYKSDSVSFSDLHRDEKPSNMTQIQLDSLLETIKSKVRGLKRSSAKKPAKPYLKMDKSASVKVEIRSRKARQLINKTLKSADKIR